MRQLEIPVAGRPGGNLAFLLLAHVQLAAGWLYFKTADFKLSS